MDDLNMDAKHADDVMHVIASGISVPTAILSPDLSPLRALGGNRTCISGANRVEKHIPRWCITLYVSKPPAWQTA